MLCCRSTTQQTTQSNIYIYIYVQGKTAKTYLTACSKCQTHRITVQYKAPCRLKLPQTNYKLPGNTPEGPTYRHHTSIVSSLPQLTLKSLTLCLVYLSSRIPDKTVLQLQRNASSTISEDMQTHANLMGKIH